MSLRLLTKQRVESARRVAKAEAEKQYKYTRGSYPYFVGTIDGKVSPSFENPEELVRSSPSLKQIREALNRCSLDGCDQLSIVGSYSGAPRLTDEFVPMVSTYEVIIFTSDEGLM